MLTIPAGGATRTERERERERDCDVNIQSIFWTNRMFLRLQMIKPDLNGNSARFNKAEARNKKANYGVT